MTRRYLGKILAATTLCTLFQGQLLLPARADSSAGAETGTAGNTAGASFDERTAGEVGDNDTPLTMPGNGSGLKLS